MRSVSRTRLPYAFLFSVLLLIIATVLFSSIIEPLHGLLNGLDYWRENYLSGLVVSVISCGVGFVFHCVAKDKALVPCAFLLTLFYTVMISVYLLVRQEYDLLINLLMPTFGVYSVMGNILFWGLFYAGRRKAGKEASGSRES